RIKYRRSADLYPDDFRVLLSQSYFVNVGRFLLHARARSFAKIRAIFRQEQEFIGRLPQQFLTVIIHHLAKAGVDKLDDVVVIDLKQTFTYTFDQVSILGLVFSKSRFSALAFVNLLPEIRNRLR